MKSVDFWQKAYLAYAKLGISTNEAAMHADLALKAFLGRKHQGDFR